MIWLIKKLIKLMRMNAHYHRIISNRRTCLIQYQRYQCHSEERIKIAQAQLDLIDDLENELFRLERKIDEDEIY